MQTTKTNDILKNMIDESKKMTSLPESFIERVKGFKNTLRDVETSTVEEALTNFQKDRNPESELELWECMALAYQDFNETNPNLTLEEKKDVLRVLLQLSCGAESFETKILDDRQIQILSGLYIYRGGKAKPVVLYKS